MSLSRATAAAAYPLTLGEAKQHLRVDGDSDDALIDALIAAATDHAESATGSKLVTQTWTWTLDAFRDCGDGIMLPVAPVQSVTSIAYLDAAGASQTLPASVYKLDPASTPARSQRLTLKYGQCWPCTYCEADAVTMTLVAGYGDFSAVPSPIKHAILLLVAELYERREATGAPVAESPYAVRTLLAPYRVWGF